MKTISKIKLKANMLDIFRKIETSGEELIVTHRAKPVARIIPIVNEQSVEMAFAGLRGQVVYHADLNEPTADEWEEQLASLGLLTDLRKASLGLFTHHPSRQALDSLRITHHASP